MRRYGTGLLSLHGEDVTILNDMIVAVEDLRSVEFTLVLVEKRSIKQSKQQSASRKVRILHICNIKYLMFDYKKT